MAIIYIENLSPKKRIQFALALRRRRNAIAAVRGRMGDAGWSFNNPIDQHLSRAVVELNYAIGIVTGVPYKEPEPPRPGPTHTSGVPVSGFVRQDHPVVPIKKRQRRKSSFK